DKILSSFRNLGYNNFVVKKPGKEFIYRESNGPIEFVISFNINGGIVLPYLYVYVEGEKVPYEYPSFVFTYKYLINDFNSSLNPSTVYTSYSDFEEIVKEVMNLYEDFKENFLRKIRVL